MKNSSASVTGGPTPTAGGPTPGMYYLPVLKKVLFTAWQKYYTRPHAWFRRPHGKVGGPTPLAPRNLLISNLSSSLFLSHGPTSGQAAPRPWLAAPRPWHPATHWSWLLFEQFFERMLTVVDRCWLCFDQGFSGFSWVILIFRKDELDYLWLGFDSALTFIDFVRFGSFESLLSAFFDPITSLIVVYSCKT
jgi:hypothetical protein